MKRWLAVGFGIGIFAGALLGRRRPPKPAVVIGFPDEWTAFTRHSPKFLKAIPLLFDSIDKVFNNTYTFDNLLDRVVYFLGKVTSEDFTEVFILSGNGHGIGGLKILRGMYERVVTISYLVNHPDEAETFWNYAPIHKYKLIVHAGKVMDLEKIFPRAVLAEIKAERDAVKDGYIDECKKCGVKFPMFSWNKGGMDTMAHGASAQLKQMYFHCYYWPTLHDHATVNNILERLELTSADNLNWKEDGQRHWVDVAASSSHWLMIIILDLMNMRFSLGLDDQLKAVADDWREAWQKSPLPTTQQ